MHLLIINVYSKKQIFLEVLYLFQFDKTFVINQYYE